jgi:hypothetical protein
MSSAPGGATIFPNLPGGASYRSAATSGTLLLFRNMLPGAQALDEQAAHRAEKTNRGNKYVMQCYVCENPGVEGHWD